MHNIFKAILLVTATASSAICAPAAPAPTAPAKSPFAGRQVSVEVTVNQPNMYGEQVNAGSKRLMVPQGSDVCAVASSFPGGQAAWLKEKIGVHPHAGTIQCVQNAKNVNFTIVNSVAAEREGTLNVTYSINGGAPISERLPIHEGQDPSFVILHEGRAMKHLFQPHATISIDGGSPIPLSGLTFDQVVGHTLNVVVTTAK
jgi:hypothetical protein